ncbi:SIR2 family protein [Limosilactobacillus reuteri]|uniref:SIR2 family protein n=1 Tax=Limosilactobacillus reuteri TaxID=1598 RepID=UPI001E5F837C|nr:SIR2 family protein [Limosilactobacillus reuteri]MCC4384132.1 SIR2 family protein [Limosilactobacillus reuteri]MCC4421288.1 SIR2 family protein [Limosilactobacillus reuteri]
MESQESINQFKSELKELAMTKKLNFLIGSGTSSRAISLMGDISTETFEERNKILLKQVEKVSKSLIRGDYNADSEITLHDYEDFILSISDVLNNANARTTPKEAIIFTTNYDLFIEKALDNVMTQTPLVFNDGARGYFNRYLDGSNYNKSVSYRGLNNNYIDELPSLSLIKPHGSVNWKQVQRDKILIKDEVVEDNPVVVPPTGYEDETTFLNNHFHDMLRIFQLELDKPQSVLFTIGFSFQDKHIAQMIRRALNNRELVIVCFCYSNDDKKKYLSNLELSENKSNLKFVTPEEFEEEHLTLGSLSAILRGDF